MQEKSTAAVRKEDRACKKKKELAGILYEFSSTDLTTGVLPVHLKKLHPKAFFFSNLVIAIPLPFRSDVRRFCEFALFDSTEEYNNDKRKKEQKAATESL